MGTDQTLTRTREVACQRCGHSRWTAMARPYKAQSEARGEHGDG